MTHNFFETRGSRRILFPLLSLALLFTQAGCFSYGQRKPATSGSWYLPGTDEGSVNGGGSSGGSSGGASDSGSDSGSESTSTGYPAMQIPINGLGYTNYYVTVPVRKVLKVAFRPGIQTGKVAGTGFTPQYSQMWVQLRVGTDARMTTILSNGLFGGAAQRSTIYDFSEAYTKTCPDSNTSCRQQVKVYVEKPNYDYACINYGGPCPGTHVQSTHPWNGTLFIQTDDTDAI